MITYVVFILRSFAGFVLSMISIWIVYPIAFAGEVFSPLIVPFIGMVCILLTAIPFTIVQGRINFSTKTRPLVPLIFGFSWMPLFFGGLYFLPARVSPSFFVPNFWIALFQMGLLWALASFIFSLCFAKVTDILLNPYDS